MNMFAAILVLVLRLLFVFALLWVSYQRGKGKTVVELTKACLPDANARSTVSTMMYWVVALCVYHLPTLACGIVVRVFAPVFRKSKAIFDVPEPTNTRKGITLEEDE